jgi:APA family basic amino acid/polyamine antiporter
MSAFQMPGYPIVPAIYIIAAVLILVLGFLRSPWPSSVAILTVLAGVPVYFIFKKTYGRKRIQV